MKNILLIEDDPLLSENISKLLKEDSYNVNSAKRLSEANCANQDLIILDWRLPDGRGIDFLKDLRSKDNELPVIMLTSKSELEDKVLGLELGANDYMTKPFAPKELLARVAVQLRQKSTQKIDKSKLNVGEVEICFDSRSVKKLEKHIELTKIEFDLLSLLIKNPNKVYSRDELLNLVWGFDAFPTTRTVDMHIKQLRQKIGQQYFSTVHGIGYKFNLNQIS